VRRLPIPVLTTEQSAALDAFGRRAVAAKESLDLGSVGEPLEEIEHDLDRYVRKLYGFPAAADLWVVR
jgi:hypothetical protein